MRLVNYGAGELADRLTILSLKVLYGSLDDREIKHFQEERQTLLVQLKSRTSNNGWMSSLLDLGAVNGALWRAEDLMKAYREEGQTSQNTNQIVELAFQIQALNERRAELVTQINTATGEFRGAEKV